MRPIFKRSVCFVGAGAKKAAPAFSLSPDGIGAKAGYMDFLQDHPEFDPAAPVEGILILKY